MTAKGLSWIITLAIAATVIALVVAPQVLSLATTIAGGSPEWLLGPPAFGATAVVLAYEVALWGTGLLVGLVGHRLGWSTGRTSVLLVTTSPVVAEMVLSRLAGGDAALTAIGATTRLIVGAGAVFVAMWASRPSPGR